MDLTRHLAVAFDLQHDRDSRLYHALAALAELRAQRERVAALANCNCPEHFPAEVATGWRCPAHGKN